MTAHLLPLYVAIPLGAAFLISLLAKSNRRIGDWLASLATLMLLVLSLLPFARGAASGVLVYSVGGWAAPLGICMVMDGLTRFMLVTLNIVSFLVTIYSLRYMERYTDKWKFYTLFMLMIAGMNGIVITGDLFNLFVFLEIASIASYALVAFGTEAEELEASFKYAIMGSVASSFILLAIAMLYSYTATLNMADISLVVAEKGRTSIVNLVAVLFLAGFGLKAAIVPFHAWLPDAHPSAPASISAMLSGVLIKVLGVYALLRIFFNIFGITHATLMILMVLGASSLLIGVFLAIGQWDLKRLLAYHSISQIGYIMVGIGLGTPLGILGGLFHLFNHSIFKSLLFINAGAVEYAAGTRDLNKMGGLKERMPVTAGTSWMASMAISGIPPFNGFWSKLIIIIACIQANRYGLAWVAVIGSILTLSSFMKVQKFAFFGPLKSSLEKVKEVPLTMQIPMVIFAAICLCGAVLLIPHIRANFIQPACDVLLSGTGYAFGVLGGQPR